MNSNYQYVTNLVSIKYFLAQNSMFKATTVVNTLFTLFTCNTEHHFHLMFTKTQFITVKKSVPITLYHMSVHVVKGVHSTLLKASQAFFRER